MKMKKRKRMGRRRTPGRNLHHLTAKSNGGPNTRDNLLLIDCTRHELWHKLWGNRSLEQVIALLQRLKRMKGRDHVKQYREAA